MDIDKVLQELDSLFTSHQIQQVEGFLKNKIEEADRLGDLSSKITLLNEMIGFYRDTSQYDKSISACESVLVLMESVGLKNSIPYATTLLNVANALRAAGQLEASKAYYDQVFLLYENKLDQFDFRYASLNNNMSLLYQEMGDFENACICLEKALVIAMRYEEARIEVATTHTNLAMSLLKLKKVEEAMSHLEKAFGIFEMDEEKDYHYSASLAAMGEANFMSGNLESAATYYKKAMVEIEKNVGKTQGYEIMEHNLQAVLEKLEQEKQDISVNKVYCSGMELSLDFYKQLGAPMIHKYFSEYEDQIAVGLVGEGSECFGFDDEISRDHDFGPGFCMWVSDAVYDEIGVELQAKYDQLPRTYQGVTRMVTPHAGKRVGVFRIKDFYEKLAGIEDIPESNNQWLFIEDYQFAVATNGKVFRDDLGEFTRIRKGLLAHYPEEVWVKKIAREATLMAQSGQYNYHRMLQRKDFVTAHIALIDFMRHTMSMVYLLNRKFAPFYKWMHCGMKDLMILSRIRELLSELEQMPLGNEMIPITIETIAGLIIEQMKRQGLTNSEDNYLDNHTGNILKSIPQKQDGLFASYTKEELVEEIVKLEWMAFDQVENKGGRADCQNDWNTFSLMRKSQFLAWPKELIASFILDFKEANEKGWNLITEKYGRMMISTDSDGYAEIQDKFPEISASKAVIIEEIVKLQVGWMEEFSKEYPKAAGNARSIHTWEDSLYNTSYETYLRGELSTYSDKTLELYGRMIVSIARENGNLAKSIITNTAILYGYSSLEEMEEGL